MKRKIIVAIALLSTVLTMNSCADFLDVQPEGYPSQSGFFKTDKDATDAMDGVYRVFGLGDDLWGRDLFWEQGCADDIVFTKSRWSTLETFNFTGDESPLRSAWSVIYEYMANAQWVIQSLLQKGEGNLSAVEKRVLGEAYFMRAFLHFHIAYRYGTDKLGVPFEPWESFKGGWNNQIYKQQETVMKNYELIISDLEDAAERLPFFETYGADNQGRAHKVAAWALMVKVWAYWAYWDSSKWALIPPMVNKIESEGHRDLLPDCADPFKIANNYSSEYIWSVTSVGGATPGGSEFPGICLRNKAWGFYNGWGSIMPTHNVYLELKKNAGDRRLQLNLIGYQPEINTFTFFGDENQRYSSNGDPVASGYSIAKYMEPYTYGEKKYKEDGVTVDGQATAQSNPYISVNGDWPTTDLHVPLIRHAEMVLFKAEALIQQGKGPDAAKELNRLAKRAGLGDNFYSTATMADLKHERRCELAFEFTDRFQDLKRWGETQILSSRTLGNVPDKTGQFDGVTCTVKEIWPVNGSRTWSSRCIVFPYPSQEIVKAGGAWRQPDGY